MRAVRSYPKFETYRHRVEIQFRGAALRDLGIRDFHDLARLAETIPERHILFARLSTKKLVTALQAQGLDDDQTSEILRGVKARKQNLLDTQRYLRTSVHLTNTGRLLTRLATNQIVQKALDKLAKEWGVDSARRE